MKQFLISISTPSPSRTWRTVTATDYERAAHSAREAAKAEPGLRNQVLRITVYDRRETIDPEAPTEWVAIFGLVDTLKRTHSGNL